MTALSAVEAQQRITTIPALQMIDNMRAKWQEGRPRKDEAGTILTDKVIAVCEILQDLVNEDAQVKSGQQYHITEMIIAVASDSELEQINDPGNGAWPLIYLASFINTCRA